MRVVKLAGFGLLLVYLGYLLLPAPVFPAPPPGALRSEEPGDQESVYRRAYFTDLSRPEILAHYTREFSGSFPHLLLNYPYEEAFSLIRDQTQSSWLQEIVHPGRESLYINGFYPTSPTEQIYRNSKHYLNKITVRYLPASLSARLTVFGLTLICGYWLIKEYGGV